ncbi:MULTISPECIES: hypothetical protein [Spirosoma]|uniref:Uncharacterized protein n=1 Tax=Spirosoma sordidisoli TaxID=2502893 RepID=A0A4Q2UPK4_9BACT|nr:MULTISPECIES: hypothetical protein [Spirosoma]RYC69550.1 hypothetical protein EQG79_13175 [Spirosoma sordidisoli]
MRLLLLSLLLSGSLTVCTAQNDTTRRSTQSNASPQKQVLVPGVDSPISSPGTLMQSSPQPNVQPETGSGKRRKTAPPSDPRAFGVGIPVGKSRKDTLRP